MVFSRKKKSQGLSNVVHCVKLNVSLAWVVQQQ